MEYIVLYNLGRDAAKLGRDRSPATINYPVRSRYHADRTEILHWDCIGWAAQREFQRGYDSFTRALLAA